LCQSKPGVGQAAPSRLGWITWMMQNTSVHAQIDQSVKQRVSRTEENKTKRRKIMTWLGVVQLSVKDAHHHLCSSTSGDFISCCDSGKTALTQQVVATVRCASPGSQSTTAQPRRCQSPRLPARPRSKRLLCPIPSHPIIWFAPLWLSHGHDHHAPVVQSWRTAFISSPFDSLLPIDPFRGTHERKGPGFSYFYLVPS
jgi:hypothetical protein